MLVAIAVIAASGVLGVVAGKLYNQRSSNNYLKSRKFITESLVRKMGTLEIGSPMPNALFLDERGERVRLSDAITSSAILMFVDPECGTCLEEIENLYAATRELELDEKVFLITRSQAAIGQWLDKRLLPDVIVLRDEDGSYHVSQNIEAIPFSIIVGPELRITEFISGVVLTSEFDSIVTKIENLNSDY